MIINEQEVEKIKEEIDKLQTKLRAIDRMESSLLLPYKEMLINMDPEWVAYAPFSDIIEWCKTAKGGGNVLS